MCNKVAITPQCIKPNQLKMIGFESSFAHWLNHKNRWVILKKLIFLN